MSHETRNVMVAAMTLKTPILRIAIRSPLWQCFDYLPPDDFENADWRPGQRVKVPFGRREVIGMLLEIVDEPAVSFDQLKKALELIDEKPILPEALLKLYRWSSGYYHHPVGDVILGTLPKLLRQGRALLSDGLPLSGSVVPSNIV